MTSQSNVNAQKTICLEVGESTFTFNVTPDSYIKFINETTPTDKFSAMHNFLIRSICDQEKAQLLKSLESPPMVLSLAGSLLQEYSPNIEVEIKQVKSG